MARRIASTPPGDHKSPFIRRHRIRAIGKRSGGPGPSIRRSTQDDGLAAFGGEGFLEGRGGGEQVDVSVQVQCGS